MESLSTEYTIALLAGVMLGLALVAGLARRLAGRKPADTTPLVTQPPQTPPTKNNAPPLQQSPAERPSSPVRLATSQPAQHPSYTAIAVADAARAVPKPPTEVRTGAKSIDYSNEATTVAVDASYTALAVAAAARAARGLPPLEPAQSSRTPSNDNLAKSSASAPEASYAAIAAANAGQAAQRESIPSAPPRIDYSNVPTNGLTNTSYTSIAVAAAARHG